MIERRHLKVDEIQTLILDEASKMLDMGFDLENLLFHIRYP